MAVVKATMKKIGFVDH